MVRPRGLDKAAKPLQSQTEKPAGNPTKSPRKMRFAALGSHATGIAQKPLEIYFRGDICEIHAADFLNFAAGKKAKKMVRPRGLEPRTQ